MKTLLLAAAFGVTSAAASAAILHYSDTVSLTTTDWSETVSVNQFDSALGTLTSVMVTLLGGVEGEAKAESLVTAPATVSLDLSAMISAATSALGEIATVLPLVSRSEDLSIFDNMIDFGGTSGFDTGTISAGVIVKSGV